MIGPKLDVRCQMPRCRCLCSSGRSVYTGPMSPIGYMDWFRTMLFLQQQLSAMAGNGNGAASTLPSGGHNDSDMENHFKSGEWQTFIDISHYVCAFLS